MDSHLKAITGKTDLRASGQTLFGTILPAEVTETANLIVVPDGALYRLPFDTIVDNRVIMLLKKHTVWYVPSGSVLNLLSKRSTAVVSSKPALAVEQLTEKSK